MRLIFVVEDDDNIREMILYALNTAGFETESFSNGDSLFPALAKKIPALILLDIMLPGVDGLDILRKLKQASPYRDVPVIMLTAKGSELDRIKGLDSGADDYITKPFSVMEVIARVKAVLRRCAGNSQTPEELTVHALSLYPQKRVVRVNGDEIQLTFKEFELLQYLMVHKGIVLSRDRLLEQIWGFDYNGESRTVDMHIKSLRQKLGPSGDVIKTVRNVGYKIGG